MRLSKWTVLMMLSIAPMVTACGTTLSTVTTTDAPQTSTSAATDAAQPRYVLCSEDPPIGYSVAKDGKEEDRGNAFDSPETVGSPKTRGTIRNHNTVVIAACAPMYDRYKEKPVQ